MHCTTYIIRMIRRWAIGIYLHMEAVMRNRLIVLLIKMRRLSRMRSWTDVKSSSNSSIRYNARIQAQIKIIHHKIRQYRKITKYVIIVAVLKQTKYIVQISSISMTHRK